jgi:hypothetical protein
VTTVVLETTNKHERTFSKGATPMFKKLTAIAILVISIPVMAYAGAWSLNTWARSAGGTISVNGGTGMRVTNGSQFANYTGGEVVAVTITPDAGYSVKYFIDQLGSTSSETADGTTAGTVNITSANASLTGSVASLWAVFHPSTLSVTASADGNASVNLTSIPFLTPGQVASRNINFDFTAKPGYVISAVSGAPAAGGITLAISANGNYAQVTIPAGYVFGSALNFVETSAVSATATSAIPNAGVPQVIANGATATLAGTTVGPAPAFTNWSCVSKPASATQPFAKASAQTATYTTPALTVNGTYVFQFRVSNTVTAKTSVTVNASASQAVGTDLGVGRTCQSCHTANGIGTNNAVYAGIYTNYSNSMHSRSTNSACTACHYGTATGGHPGSLNAGTVDPGTFVVNAGVQTVQEPGKSAVSVNPGSIFCTGCHNGTHPIPHSTTVLLGTCANCHTRTGTSTTGTLDAHGIQNFSNITILEAECVNCHRNPAGSMVTGIWTNYSTSIHHNAPTESSCAGCHGSVSGSPTASAHPSNGTFSLISTNTFRTKATLAPSLIPLYGGTTGTQTLVAPGSVFCTACHNASSPYGVPAHVAIPLNPGVSCAACHTDATGHNAGTGDAHSIQGLPMCIQCHSIAQKQTNATLINDNSGVRAITGEFTKWSHHVTGRAVQDSDCATCHMEGSYSRGAIGVNAAYHMADDFIHLRNCNATLPASNMTHAASANIEALSGGSASTGTVGSGTVQYLWNPDSATPDHTAMDQFCMSCHNSGGAPTAIAAVGGANALATALNPFGDTISNQYDQIQRPAVVAVFDQFDTGNTSHHAVRGQRYTSATLTQAAYNNISTVNSGTAGWKLYSSAAIAHPGGVAHSVTNKQLISTMAQSPLAILNTLYQPLGKAAGALADNITIHCGDCHTVGQYKAGSTVTSLGAATTQVIGAHGSQNEYMLRKPDGTESHNFSFSSMSTSSTLSGLSTTSAAANNGIVAGLSTQNNLVCYLCHNAAAYQPADSHDGTGPCLADGYNTAGLVGRARITASTYYSAALGAAGFAPNASATAYTEAAYQNMSTEIVNDHESTSAGTNIFGNKCLNCHNAGATNGGTLNFGGIHGNKNNATYSSFSSTSVASSAAPAVKVTGRQPYRFLPGLGNIAYNGGNNPNAWQQKYTRTLNPSQGCYTLNGTSTGATANNNLIYAAKGSFTPSNAAATSDNGVLGSWGACADHRGTSTNPTGDAPTRSVIRPLTY